MPEFLRTPAKPVVLCVDDNKSNLLALEALLSGLDIILIMAQSGSEAIEISRSQDFVVILMDVMMPEMDGLETARKIRALENNKHTPLIFVTAHPLDQMRTLQGYDLGAIDYIQKPIAPEVLRHKVSVFIALFRRQQELQEYRLREMRRTWEADRLLRELEQQKELAEISASYRLFVDSVKDYAIFLLDTDGKIRSWNPGVKRILGYDREEIEGLDFSAIFTHEDNQRSVPKSELQKAIDHGRAEDTRWHLRKNGSLFWADGVVVPLLDNSEHKGYAKLLRDRTEGKLAEEALLVSEERLRLATEATNLGTWDWNLITGELKWSDRTREFYSVTPDVPITQDIFFQAIHPEDRKRVTENLENAKLPDGDGDFSLDYRTNTGENNPELWLSVRGKVFFDGGRTPIRMLGTCWDISARKRMESDLRRSNEDLERFAHIASHDLQEPLRMVATYLQLVEKNLQDNLDPKIRDYLRFAVDGALRMKALIQELISYSSVGSSPPALETVSVQEIISDVLTNLKVAIDDSDAVVKADPLPYLRGDRIQLSQLFQNLVENAIKYRSMDPLLVHISCSKKKGEWLFCVRDNGIGIESEQVEKIFEPFRRLHARSSRPGAGLGLSICRRIVETHGGKIWVESVPGKGSAFCFTIPAESGRKSA
jgi:PAS domain S-box-containing protein